MATKPDIMAKIVDKADSDAAFREQLKNDPKAAIKSLGLSTRANVNVKVLEESADEGYIVLPFRTQAGAGGALSDDALGAATGGAALGCAVCGQG